MTTHNSKKFPYLVLRNLTPEQAEEKSNPGSKDHQSKRDVNVTQRVCATSNNTPVGESVAHHDYLYGLSDPLIRRTEIPLKELLTSSDQSLYNGFSTAVSYSKMKAILTAQKELRKPAGSLYPSPSQISLIPETELIYKKYFPTEENESKIQKAKQKGIHTIPSCTSSPPVASVSQKVTSATSSVSESTISMSNKKTCSGDASGKTEPMEASKSVSNDKHVVVRPKDADARFRKRAHQQLVSLSTEVERLSTELNDLKKELKEVRTVVRKNSSDNDSSKSNVDSLSRQVLEMDGKLDCLQESVNTQEKSILSKLMLIGEMSDSDSDYEGRDQRDASSSPSNTKLTSMTTAKRPTATSLDSFPKACSNWIPIAPDFDKLLHAVALLNYRMDRNQSMKMCTSSNGNGFRSYSTMSVIRFVNELFNGYLPTELSTQYPDGVVIVLTDRRSIVHSIDERFKGPGSMLSVLESPPDLLPGTDINSLSRKQSMESILPSTTASLISLTTDASSKSSTSESTYKILPDLKLHDIANHGRLKMITLKMRDRKSGCKYKLKVSTQCTIKAVVEHISKAVPGHNEAQVDLPGDNNSTACEVFDLILPVPYGRLSCLNSTLEEYGIKQNTLVYIQQQQTKHSTDFKLGT
ncbi:UBX domain-containing protein 11 [Orchesella cincta]|uniref:UBX domain-containing protein 11 n=1 Tax=Orchesella cincta TaxID=48709 RepID=A0A1D2MT26_ORCCI|nr:UBX domain-containing protein 11 [Orchesella cincta]